MSLSWRPLLDRYIYVVLSDVRLFLCSESVYTIDMYPKLSGKERLSQQVADHIVMLIEDGRLEPGDKLPNEQQLAELFGLSRPTIREAIRSLVTRHVLEVVRGRGTFVTAKPGVETDPLGLNLLSGDDLRGSLAEARLIIEPGVARLAAEKADPQDIEKIETHLADMEQIVRERMVSMSIELEFHRSIANASKNPVIVRIVPLIMESIIRTYDEARRTRHDHATALEEHKHIVAAIRDRDGDRAEASMRSHLQRSIARTLAKADKGESPPPIPRL